MNGYIIKAGSLEELAHQPGFDTAGNTTASVMGHHYPGSGATIGAAMTFAYLAALDAAHTSLATEKPVMREV